MAKIEVALSMHQMAKSFHITIIFFHFDSCHNTYKRHSKCFLILNYDPNKSAQFLQHTRLIEVLQIPEEHNTISSTIRLN